MFGHRRVLVVEVDRDSVAMGDDMRSHAYRETLRDGALLATVLEQVHPEILSRGWSWVAVVDGTVSAVWSVDHGVQLLVQNRRLRAGEPATRVFFRYFLQIDPQWLHQRLASGAAPDREALNEEYAPIAAERLEAEQRRREREVPQKLLSTQGIEALVRLGATIDLHSDTRCRLDAHGVRWTLVRSDTMTLVHRADTRYSVASIRPMSFAELWLATAIGARRRQQLGVTPLPSVALRPSPALKAMHSLDPDAPRWSAHGPDRFVAQLSGEDAATWYRFAFGRSLDEIVETLTA